MSIFEHVPNPFPLDVKIDQRPVTYQLKADVVSSYVAIILNFFWAGLIGFVIWLSTHPANIYYQNQFDSLSAFGAGAIGLTFVFFGRRIWREVKLLRINIEVSISQDLVTATGSGLRENNYCIALSDYAGLIKESWGSQQVNGDKTQVVALILKHKNPNKSVPLIITSAKKLGRGRIDRYAKSLGLEVLSYDHAVGLNADMPQGTIYANTFQSMKVKYVSWFLMLIGAAIIFVAGALLLSIGVFSLEAGFEQPLLNRALISMGMAVVGGGLIWGMMFYMGRYIYLLQIIDDEVHLKTARGQTFVFKADQVDSLSHKSGKLFTGRQAVDTPYAWLKIKGQKRQFLIDWQAEFIDEIGLKKLVS